MCKSVRVSKEKKQVSHHAIRLDKTSLNQGERKCHFKEMTFLPGHNPPLSFAHSSALREKKQQLFWLFPPEKRQI